MASDYELAEVLREFAQTMVTDFPIQEILDQLVTRIVQIMPVTSAGVTLIAPGVENQNVEAHYIAASNDSALQYEQLQTDLGEGPCVAAYQSGEAVAMTDVTSDDRFPVFSRRAAQAGLGAVFTFPLRHGDRRIGALDLYREIPGVMSPETMTAAQTLADVAAVYIANAQARGNLQDSADRSRDAALHDPLTGLANRMLLMERLDHALLRAPRSGTTVAVLFGDLDGFKAINDSHGHRVGDALLIAVGRRLGDLLRVTDTIARFAGDEFVIVCEDVDSRTRAEGIAVRLQDALRQPFLLSGTEVTIAASMGVAFADQAGVTAEQLVHNADLAMYDVKRSKDGRRVLDLRDENLAASHSSFENDLAGVIDRGELHLDYEPIVSIVNGRVTSVEAITRWAHPTRGLIAPSVLSSLVDNSSSNSHIGRWRLGQALTDRAQWQRLQPNHDVTLSVKVSSHELMGGGFTDMVASALAAVPTRAGLLMLAFGEDAFLRDGPRTLMVLRDLQDLGVRVGLDDYGTGESPLNQLERYGVDAVTIDRTYVHNLQLGSPHRTVVAAVVRVAHRLGIAVTADGVETRQQHDELALVGCDFCQGPYVASPMTAGSIGDLLEHRNALRLLAPDA